nr:hypothetical protein [Tanacetum cinerariifolium]
MERTQIVDEQLEHFPHEALRMMGSTLCGSQMIENHSKERLVKEVLMMKLVMHTEKNDTMFYMEKTGMLMLVVEIDVGGMTADVVDKLTCSSDDVQPKQVDLRFAHALTKIHWCNIHVVPDRHDVDQRGVKISSKSHRVILPSCMQTYQTQHTVCTPSLALSKTQLEWLLLLIIQSISLTGSLHSLQLLAKEVDRSQQILESSIHVVCSTYTVPFGSSMSYTYPSPASDNLCAYDCSVNIMWYDCTCMHRAGRPLGAYDLGVATLRALKKSESNSQNMAFISSAKHSSENEEVYTASVSTASTNVSSANANIEAASISQETACAYIASKSNGSQIKFKDINQIDEDDMAPRSQDRGRRDNFRQGSKVEEQTPKALMEIDRVGWDWSFIGNEQEDHALVADEEVPTEFALMAKTSAESETGLPEFQDDTITNYSRPSPTIESTSDDVQNKNTSVTKTEPSPSTISPKPFIKFVKATDRSIETKIAKVETAKPTVKYATMYSKPSKSSKGNSQKHIDDKGYWDSGCSRHMTGNISYLTDYKPFNGGYVSFGQGGCKITGKGTIKTGKLEFENVYFVKDLKYNLFSVIVLGQNFKLSDDANVLLRTPRQHNMYSIDLNNIVSHKDLTCLVAKASADECRLWHRRLVVTDDFSRFTWNFFLKTKDETSGILRKFITEIENLKDLKLKIIRCDNGGEFRNKEMNDFCSQKGIKREFSNAKTP